MSAGAIPVIVARDWVRPFSELVDWPSFSFLFSPEEVPNMLQTLRAVPKKELDEMQASKENVDQTTPVLLAQPTFLLQ